MINAKELRIGNLLYSNLTKVNFAVTAEDIVYIYTKEPRVADPITITTEILQSFGFVKIEVLLFAKGSFHIRQNVKSYYYYTDCYRVELKSVHQLQNLYFALTGKEIGNL